MIKLTPQRLKFVEIATEKFGESAILGRSQINEFVQSTGCLLYTSDAADE